MSSSNTKFNQTVNDKMIEFTAIRDEITSNIDELSKSLISRLLNREKLKAQHIKLITVEVVLDAIQIFQSLTYSLSRNVSIIQSHVPAEIAEVHQTFSVSTMNRFSEILACLHVPETLKTARELHAKITETKKDVDELSLSSAPLAYDPPLSYVTPTILNDDQIRFFEAALEGIQIRLTRA